MIHGFDSFRLWIALQEASKLVGECGFLGVSTESSIPCVEGGLLREGEGFVMCPGLPLNQII